MTSGAAADSMRKATRAEVAIVTSAGGGGSGQAEALRLGP